jgi:hypothetical protein
MLGAAFDCGDVLRLLDALGGALRLRLLRNGSGGSEQGKHRLSPHVGFLLSSEITE